MGKRKDPIKFLPRPKAGPKDNLANPKDAI